MPLEFHKLDPGRLRDPEVLQLGFVLLMMITGFLSIAVSQICLGSALILLFYRWVFGKQRPPRTGMELSVIMLAVWALVMVAFSTDRLTSLVFYRRFFLFAAIWVVASVATSEQRRWLVFACGLLGALAVSMYGATRLVLETGSVFGARFGAMSNPMTSGSLLMMLLLVGLGFLLSAGHSRRFRLILGAALLPVLLGTVLTMTRSAFIGVITGLGMMLLLSHRRWLVAFVLLAVVGSVVLFGFGDRFLPPAFERRLSLDYQFSGKNTTARVEMWRGGWEMVKARPLTGFGDRGLETVAPDYYGDSSTVYHGHLHNNFVHMAVIWGIPGLLLGILVLVWPGVLLLRRWRNRLTEPRAGPALTGWILGACGVWLGFFLAGFTEWYFGDAETMLIYLAFLGCALGTSVRQPA
ncbi:hypothetical protein DRQ50_03990 [bacterium]|nr:MAG: hypothetical protein DRQ50_03990 [bacterium]